MILAFVSGPFASPIVGEFFCISQCAIYRGGDKHGAKSHTLTCQCGYSPSASAANRIRAR